MIRLNPSVFRPCVVRAAGISTSKKNKDTVNLTDALVGQAKTQQQADAVAEKVSRIRGNFYSFLFLANEKKKNGFIIYVYMYMIVFAKVISKCVCVLRILRHFGM